MPKSLPEVDRPYRILLCSVFGPYGVDDEYGRKENIMELLHNQVTKGQGLASWRFHHRSFGLYLLAANIEADVSVLDFPSRQRFIRELENDYDVVGISFITPNLAKAQEMARLTREHAPESVLVFGGHGTAIEGIEELLEHDYLARGEGIRWLRKFLGQDTEAPIAHPPMPNIESMAAYGVPLPLQPANLLVTGVGCVNGCRFCSTSHFFNRWYTPFIATGKELFDVCCQTADQTGTHEFYIMDENFLKVPARADELLELMEKHERHFSFNLFSSADTVLSFGLDRLLRLGVDLIWIGFEAPTEQGNFEKNRGIDAKDLVRELRARGIRVLASGILCQEHHTRENIQQDIDFMVELEADLVQFMLLTPLPTTKLYRQHQEQGTLRTDLPYEEWHGQKHMSYVHPEFPGDEPEKVLNRAFRQDYEVNSGSLLRVIDTAFRGYQYLSLQTDLDPMLQARLKQFLGKVQSHRLMLPTIALNAVNPQERERARQLDRLISKTVGPPNLKQHFFRSVAPLLAWRWKMRLAMMGDMFQPRTILTHFPAGDHAHPTVQCVEPITHTYKSLAGTAEPA